MASVDPALLAGVDILAETEKSDEVDSEYQFADNEQQNVAIKTITCVVALFGAICVFMLLYIGVRLLSNDNMGSSASSKLNRSDDSGHIMIGGVSTSPDGKQLIMESKYYIAASTATVPTSPQVSGSDKLSAQYHLLAPELVSTLEKGSVKTPSHRSLKPMNTTVNINNNCNHNNNHNRIPNIASSGDCNCLAKNCKNCCSANVKFANEHWTKNKRLNIN